MQAICDAVESCAAEGPGDILVFLSGEREIRDTADALRPPAACGTPRSCRCTPGCRRPSSTGSSTPHTGRRVVLATNVAETSLTVPGIRYVVDPGTARISRYSTRLKVQRLPIEPISQASANQRAGRCGRLEARHLHPAVLRGGLRGPARVHRPGDPAHQPGLGHPADEPRSGSATSRPSRSSTRRTARRPRRRRAAARARRPRSSAGRRPKRLTPLGRQLAQLPVDPRLARMVVEADRNGCAARGARHRRGAVDPGPARAPARAPAGRRRGTPPVRRPALGLPRLSSTSGTTCASSATSCRRPRSGGCASGSTCTTCGCASGRTSSPSCAQMAKSARRRPRGDAAGPDDAAAAQRIHTSLLAGLLSHVGLQEQQRPRVPRRARREVRALARVRRWRRSRPRG